MGTVYGGMPTPPQLSQLSKCGIPERDRKVMARNGGKNALNPEDPLIGSDRMLHPPPMLRVTGPLFPVLTNATLFSILPPDISPLTQRPMSTQTHVIPLAEPLLTTTSQRPGRQRNLEREEAKRQLREAAAKSGFGASLPHERRRPLAREREVLGEGLAFSGLWVGEEVGKAKEFRLQLSLGRPGVEEEQEVGQTQTPGPEEVARMLDPEIQEQASIDGLPDLEGEITPHDETTLVEHLNTSADLAPLDSTPMAILPEIKPAFQPWATFLSEPLTVVSKPSQKTAKARSLASCLSQRDSVALWVRINGQTVRTKYMKLEPFGTPQLTAKTGKWTPFRFDVIHRAVPPPTQAKPVKISSKVNGEDEVAEVLTYGSLVVLVDLQSGVRSEAVKLVRVERNEAVVGADEGHPVSELQRVGFVREEPDHQEAMGRGRWYLSAPGARLGGGELLDPSAKGRNASRRSAKLTAVVADTEESRAPETLGGVEKDSHPAASGSVTQVRPAKKRKTSRNALAMATLAEDEDHSSASLLSWKQAEREEREIVTDDGKVTLTQNVVVEMVEDFMCWVIGGVCE